MKEMAIGFLLFIFNITYIRIFSFSIGKLHILSVTSRSHFGPCFGHPLFRNEPFVVNSAWNALSGDQIDLWKLLFLLIKCLFAFFSINERGFVRFF